MKNNSILNLTLRLVIITICAGLILGLVYSVTKEPIAKQNELKETTARQQVLPEAEDFELLEEAEEGSIIQQIYAGTSGGDVIGYAFSVVTKGYSAGLTLTVGMSADGVVTGVNIVSHEETAGLGANATKPEFLNQYQGSDIPLTVVKTPTGAQGEITAITGATITSDAVTGAVNTVRDYFEQNLKGGE